MERGEGKTFERERERRGRGGGGKAHKCERSGGWPSFLGRVTWNRRCWLHSELIHRQKPCGTWKGDADMTSNKKVGLNFGRMILDYIFKKNLYWSGNLPLIFEYTISVYIYIFSLSKLFVY